MEDGITDHRFPCEQCGADYRFDPEGGGLFCDHCGHKDTIEVPYPAPAIRENDFRAAVEKRLPDEEIEETRVLGCTNCGAQVEFDEAEHAAECPFCATPVVTGTGPHRHIKPKGVLPFAVEEEAARAALGDWLGGLWFAPAGVADYARKGRKMAGIYVPYWTFDADTKSTYQGERGTDYYVNKTVVRDGKRTTQRVRKTRWRSVSGRVARFFDDVLVLGSQSLPKKYTDGLEPWDLSNLAPYQPEYLAGFRAEGYTVELTEAFQQARAYMDKMILRDVRYDIGGDRQRVHDVNSQINDVTFKHILLPVWCAAYKYRGKSFQFVINGRTGRVQGQRPWSVWKITFAVLLAAIIIGGIGYGLALQQQ